MKKFSFLDLKGRFTYDIYIIILMCLIETIFYTRSIDLNVKPLGHIFLGHTSCRTNEIHLYNWLLAHQGNACLVNADRQASALSLLGDYRLVLQ